MPRMQSVVEFVGLLCSLKRNFRNRPGNTVCIESHSNAEHSSCARSASFGSTRPVEGTLQDAPLGPPYPIQSHSAPSFPSHWGLTTPPEMSKPKLMPSEKEKHKEGARCEVGEAGELMGGRTISQLGSSVPQRHFASLYLHSCSLAPRNLRSFQDFSTALLVHQSLCLTFSCSPHVQYCLIKKQ